MKASVIGLFRERGLCKIMVAPNIILLPSLWVLIDTFPLLSVYVLINTSPYNKNPSGRINLS